VTTRVHHKIEELSPLAEPHKLGVLVAFITEWDSQSPLMLGVYEDFAEALEVPLLTVDADQINEQDRHALRVFSAPTLLWLRTPDPGHRYPKGMIVDTVQPPFEVLMRQVGTVMQNKLVREVEQILEEISVP
jgi:hypothetical protein